jgi:phage major head subunit gpT-like protein
MAVISSGAHPKALWPGIKQWFGREYKKHPEIWSKVFEMDTSDKSYEEDVELTGFGLVPVKAEGSAINYDSETQGYVTRYINVTYGMGYIVTQEALEDDQYEKVSKRRSSALAFSAQTTKETVHGNILNRFTTAGYTGGDGVVLGSASHPTVSGTQSNILSTPADLSEASLEDLCVQIMNATNSRGLRIALEPQKLIVPPALHFDAKRIIESDQTPDTANNAKNVVAALFKGGLVTWTFLTDTDQWFVQTNCPRGLVHFKRRAGAFTTDNDFDTSNAKAKFTERYSAGWSDWRGVFGTPGA